MKSFLATLITVVFIGFLLLAVMDMPPLGTDDPITHNEVMNKYLNESIPDTGAINVVSAVILDYRAFDTFIESSVIFTAFVFVLAAMKRGELK